MKKIIVDDEVELKLDKSSKRTFPKKWTGEVSDDEYAALKKTGKVRLAPKPKAADDPDAKEPAKKAPAKKAPAQNGGSNDGAGGGDGTGDNSNDGSQD
jgi:hypothetical protein